MTLRTSLMGKICIWIYMLAVAIQPLSAQKLPQLKEEDNLRKLFMANVFINMLYVDSVDNDKLTEDAIRGMLSKLDPHSSYSNAKETQRLNEPLSGNFEGIGVQFNMLEDTLLVIQPVSKGPSERAGILAGDRIITVNDTTIAGVNMDRDKIMQLLRGPKDTSVKLGVKRTGVSELLTFHVVRDKIPLHSMNAAYMIRPNIGLIRIDNFGETTHKEMVDAIRKLQNQGMKKLILDLQQNGGGYLGAAINIANELLEKDDLIVYTKGRTSQKKEYKSRGKGVFNQGALAVLVDEYSASASEIVAGAIQDQDRGIIVGRRTFGKGLVQSPVKLPDGSMIRLTTARYYTPSGRCIQKPYEKGSKNEYDKDVLNRYNRGELTHADSIHFPDSLRYTTLREKRAVYGGGGIMPDYFVALDTTRFTPLHRQLMAQGMIVNASLRYIEHNRKELKKEYPVFSKFLSQYETPDALINEILKEGEKKKLEAKDNDEKEFTRKALKNQLKALIARDLWDYSEYFQVSYLENDIVQKAVELLEKEK